MEQTEENNLERGKRHLMIILASLQAYLRNEITAFGTDVSIPKKLVIKVLALLYRAQETIEVLW